MSPCFAPLREGACPREGAFFLGGVQHSEMVLSVMDEYARVVLLGHFGLAYKGGCMASKDFTPAQVEVLVASIVMYVKSMERRIVAEVDVEARAVWQRKVDAANVLLSKVRTV